MATPQHLTANIKQFAHTTKEPSSSSRRQLSKNTNSDPTLFYWHWMLELNHPSLQESWLQDILAAECHSSKTTMLLHPNEQQCLTPPLLISRLSFGRWKGSHDNHSPSFFLTLTLITSFLLRRGWLIHYFLDVFEKSNMTSSWWLGQEYNKGVVKAPL